MGFIHWAGAYDIQVGAPNNFGSDRDKEDNNIKIQKIQRDGGEYAIITSQSYGHRLMERIAEIPEAVIALRHEMQKGHYKIEINPAKNWDQDIQGFKKGLLNRYATLVATDLLSMYPNVIKEFCQHIQWDNGKKGKKEAGNKNMIFNREICSGPFVGYGTIHLSRLGFFNAGGLWGPKEILELESGELGYIELPKEERLLRLGAIIHAIINPYGWANQSVLANWPTPAIIVMLPAEHGIIPLYNLLIPDAYGNASISIKKLEDIVDKWGDIIPTIYIGVQIGYPIIRTPGEHDLKTKLEKTIQKNPKLKNKVLVFSPIEMGEKIFKHIKNHYDTYMLPDFKKVRVSYNRKEYNANLAASKALSNKNEDEICLVRLHAYAPIVHLKRPMVEIGKKLTLTMPMLTTIDGLLRSMLRGFEHKNGITRKGFIFVCKNGVSTVLQKTDNVYKELREKEVVISKNVQEVEVLVDCELEIYLETYKHELPWVYHSLRESKNVPFLGGSNNLLLVNDISIVYGQKLKKGEEVMAAPSLYPNELASSFSVPNYIVHHHAKSRYPFDRNFAFIELRDPTPMTGEHENIYIVPSLIANGDEYAIYLWPV